MRISQFRRNCLNKFFIFRISLRFLHNYALAYGIILAEEGWAVSNMLIVDMTSTCESWPMENCANSPLPRAVSWAAGEGIVSGLPDGGFAPEQNVTRAQFVVFAQRYVNTMGKQTPEGGGVGTYRDWRRVPA